MLYDPADLLARIDRHPLELLGGLFVATTFQTIWLVNAILVARRDRAHSIPVACTLLWFAHDIGFVVRLGYWRSEYDHWFLNVFWLGLLSAALLELVFLRQIVRYGQSVLAPHATRPLFTVVLAVAAVGTIVVWEYLRALVGDPLYLASSAMTLALYALFGPAMYLSRGGRLGQGTVMWVSFTAMTAVWWMTTALGFPGVFHSPQYLVMGAFSVTVGMVMSIVVFRARRVGGGAEPIPVSARAAQPAGRE